MQILRSARLAVLFAALLGLAGPALADAPAVGSAAPAFKLQDQAGKISDKLLGDYKKNNGAVDFYYRRGSDGHPYLFFVTADDLADRMVGRLVCDRLR